MFRQVCKITFVIISLTSFLFQPLAQDTIPFIDPQADPQTRASAAIALAVANGYDVQISATELADVLLVLESSDFVVNPDVKSGLAETQLHEKCLKFNLCWLV